MNRCTICGYKIKELETFCNSHKEMIENFYIPENNLIVKYFITELIKKQLVDIYYIKEDKMLPPIEYKEINGREKFLEYSKKVTKENLNNKIHNELRSIFHFNGSVENKLNYICITLDNGGFDYETIDKLNENGFIFQSITYKTKLFSRDVKCVISVTFDPEIPKNGRLLMSCKGICKRYKAKKSHAGPRYSSGQSRCQVCDIFIHWDGIFCPCCRYRLRKKPRNKAFKAKFHEAIK